MIDQRAIGYGEELTWLLFLIGSAAYACATAVIDRSWTLSAAPIVVITALIAIRRKRWIWPIVFFWVAIAALALPPNAAAIMRPTGWVLPAEAIALALVGGGTAGAPMLDRRAGRLAVAAMLALFGAVHLYNAIGISGLIPEWLPVRTIAPYASGTLQLLAAAWLVVRPARWRSRQCI